MEQIQTLQEGRWFFFCFRIKPGLLTLPLSCLQIHKHQAPYLQVVSSGFLVMIWKARDIGFVVLIVFPVLSAWWLWACFGCAFLYLLGSVSNLLLHPGCEPLGTHSLFLVSWSGFPMELHIDVLSCANPSAVNTHHSPKPFYLSVPPGAPMLIFLFSFHLCQLQVYYSSL